MHSVLHYENYHKSVLLGAAVYQLYACFFELQSLTVGNLIKMLTNLFSYDHRKNPAHYEKQMISNRYS